MTSRHAPAPAAPIDLPDDAVTAIRVFPYRDAGNPERIWFLYDIWVVDAQCWSGRLLLFDARALLVSVGMTEKSAVNRLKHAREKLRELMGTGQWRGSVPTASHPSRGSR